MGKETVSPINYQKTESLLSFQNEIREGRARISGIYPDNFPKLLDQSDKILKSLLETEDGKKNFDRIHQLADNLHIPKTAMESTYLEGLRHNIKAGYRLGLFEVSKNNNQLLENLIGSYTLSFRQTLRSFDKNRDQHKKNTKFILEIASKLYLIKPDIYQKLTQDYQDDDFVEKWMFKYFILHNSADPKAAIERAKVSYTNLLDYYKGDDFVDPSMIKHYVVNNISDPKAAIERAKVSYTNLLDYYKGDDFVDPNTIRYFVVNNPIDPKAAIEKAREIYINMEDQYKKDDFVENWMRKYFAIHNPTTYQAAIEKAKKAFLKAKEIYPNISSKKIKDAVVYYPDNYTEYLILSNSKGY